MKTIKIDFFDKDVELIFVKSQYTNNSSTAISLITNVDEYFEDFGILTVCIPEYIPKENEILVKTWSENEPFKQLLDTSVFQDTGKRVSTGFVEAEVWKIIDDSYIYTIDDINKLQIDNKGL